MAPTFFSGVFLLISKHDSFTSRGEWDSEKNGAVGFFFMYYSKHFTNHTQDEAVVT